MEEEEAAQRRCTLCSHLYIECVMLLCVLLLLQVLFELELVYLSLSLKSMISE
ncbi:hypothetical protein OIU79_026113 [Salix purpurea]|nr:hypothetical protein OIU79_026113 [Salix purpurea]